MKKRYDWLFIASHVAGFNQSECIVSVLSSYFTLKLVNEIVS